MGVLKLKAIFDDVKFSYRFAQTHMSVGLPSFMSSHRRQLDQFVQRSRATDVEMSRLDSFRDSINHNAMDPDVQDGTRDYTQMADILIRRSGLLDHYAGPRDVRDWADARNLKDQFSQLMDSVRTGDLRQARTDGSALINNKAVQGSMSVARLALHSAVNEIAATVDEEVSPAVLETIVTTLVEDLNVASLEVFGEKITVEDFKNYLHEVDDGMFASPDFKG